MRRVVALLLFMAIAASAPAAQYSARKTASGKRLTIAILDPRRDDLRLFWKSADGTPFGTLESLRRHIASQGKRLVFAMNSGIYTMAVAPEGLHVEQGRALVPLNTRKCRQPCGNFYVQPNGVFSVSTKGVARVVKTDDFDAGLETLKVAVQSGPLLAMDGQVLPSFTAQSTRRTTRNGVGVTKEGRVILAIAHDPLNMHEFATALIDAGARDVLYFDGTISGSLSPYGRSGRGEYAGMIGIVE